MADVILMISKGNDKMQSSTFYTAYGILATKK